MSSLWDLLLVSSLEDPDPMDKGSDMTQEEIAGSERRLGLGSYLSLVMDPL